MMNIAGAVIHKVKRAVEKLFEMVAEVYEPGYKMTNAPTMHSNTSLTETANDVARKKGLLKICALYLHFLQHYPAWQQCDPERICSLVTDMRYLRGDREGPAASAQMRSHVLGEGEVPVPPVEKGKGTISEMAFKLKQKEYIFKLMQHAAEDGTRGTLELRHGDQTIFALEMFKSRDPVHKDPTLSDLDSSFRDLLEDWGYLPRWEVTDVGAFIDGPWTDDFKELMTRVWTEDEELARKYATSGRKYDRESWRQGHETRLQRLRDRDTAQLVNGSCAMVSLLLTAIVMWAGWYILQPGWRWLMWLATLPVLLWLYQSSLVRYAGYVFYKLVVVPADRRAEHRAKQNESS